MDTTNPENTWKTPEDPAMPGAGVLPFPKKDLNALWKEKLTKDTIAAQQVGPSELELPSGMVIRAYRPHILHLFQNGKIPDALTPLVEKIISMTSAGMVDDSVKSVLKEFETDEVGAYERFAGLLDLVWLSAVVEPKFSHNPAHEPGSFPVAMVEFDDKMFLFQWCQGVTDSIANFRAGQARIMEATQNGESLFDTAIKFIRDKPV